MNQITIGRNPGSTIVVDPRFAKVSGNHATIVVNGSSVVFQDHSTNGSTVNGAYIHNSSCQLRNGDSVILAREYTLDVTKVFSMTGSGNSIQTQRLENQYGRYNGGHDYEYRQGGDSRSVPQCLEKWNWGAFLLGWIWAICHGIYWPLITLIPYIGWVASFVINIILGVNGSKMAWQKFNGSADEFDEKEEKWKKYSIVYVVAVIGLSMLTTLFFLAALS